MQCYSLLGIARSHTVTTHPPSYPHTYRPTARPQRGAPAPVAIGLSLLVHVGVVAAVIVTMSGRLQGGGAAGDTSGEGGGIGRVVHVRLVPGAVAMVPPAHSAPVQSQGAETDAVVARARRPRVIAVEVASGSGVIRSAAKGPSLTEATRPPAATATSFAQSSLRQAPGVTPVSVDMAPAHVSAADTAPEVMRVEAAPSASVSAFGQTARARPPAVGAAPGTNGLGSGVGSWPGPGDVDHAARPRRAIRPQYPGRSRRRGEESTVLIRAWVDERGEVFRAAVLESGGEAFDDSARYAVHHARFVPARDDGVDVASHVSLRIHFSLLD